MTVRIRYSCPHCGRRIAHHPELAGQLVICSACKGEFYEPTDPLPGKSAEKALKPLPQEPRRLRVPVEMPSKDHKHDLAILSREGSSDLRSIQEIVEAVLLDDEEPSAGTTTPTPQPSSPLNTARPNNPAALAPTPVTPKTSPPNNPAPQATKLPGPAIRPLMPPTSGRPPGTAPMAIPAAAKPVPPSETPMFVPVPTPGSRPNDVSTAASKNANRPIPAPGLAGATPQQMLEELRRRGLGAALLTCEMAPMRKLELTFSDNMTQDDALVLMRTYLESLRDPNEKPANRPGLFKRLWGGDEQS